MKTIDLVIKRNEVQGAEELLLRNLFINELSRIYWTEKHSLKLLTRMGRKAYSGDLKACFKGHLLATKEQLTRLEQIFKILDLKPRSKKFQLMETIFGNGRLAMRITSKSTLSRDLALIAVAEKMEYTEIEKYLDLVQLSDLLAQTTVSEIIGETIQEEREAWETFAAVKQDIEGEMSRTIDLKEENMAFEEEEVLQVEELEAS